MSDREHPDLRLQIHEDHGIRKAREQCASDHEVDRQIEEPWERGRRVPNHGQDALNLGKEFQLEPWPSRPVPYRRLRQLIDRLRRKADYTQRLESRRSI